LLELGEAMADTKKDHTDGATPEQLAGVKDLVPTGPATGFGLILVATTLLVFYVQVKTWPISVKDAAGADTGKYDTFSLFGCEFENVAADTRLLIAVLMAGALGSLIHALTSFADYAANKQLGWSWVLWIFMRVPTGMALALAFYFVVRGGFVSSVSAGAGTPYAYAGLAALVGMFALQTTDKLKEIFEIIFTQKNPVNRSDPLAAAKLAIGGTVPDKVTVGKAVDTMLINGLGFVAGTKLTINGKLRDAELVTAAQLKIKLDKDDVKDTGLLTLVVTNPEPNASTFKYTVRIAPEITKAPAELTAGKTDQFTVDGVGFHAQCKAKIGGKERTTTVSPDGKQLTVTPDKDDGKGTDSLELVAENPAANGGASDPVAIKVAAAGAGSNPTPAAGTKPKVTTSSPITVKKDAAGPVTIAGQGFAQGCKGMIGSGERPTHWTSDKQVEVTLDATDVATSGAKLQLVIKNPGATGQSSDPVAIEVQ
jgi:hypothetical protein